MPVRTVLVGFGLVLALGAGVLSGGCGGETPSTTPPVSTPAPASSPTTAAPSSGESNPQTDKVTVPDVVGMGFQTARMTLGVNHLSFEIVSDPPDADLPMDNSTVVTKQEPEGDAVVDSGSTVTLTVEAR